MRTTTEIFEAVLDSHVPERHVAAYREEFRQAMINGPAVKTCAFLVLEDSYGHHPVPCGVPAPNYLGVDGLPRCDQHATGARRVTPWPDPPEITTRPDFLFPEPEVPLSAPEQALADANPSTYVPPEPTASAEEAFQGGAHHPGTIVCCDPGAGSVVLPPGQPVKPPRVGPGTQCSCCSNPEPAADDAFYLAPWCGVCGHPGAAHARPAEEPDDEEFRRRRDESAERYTRPDGSER